MIKDFQTMKLTKRNKRKISTFVAEELLYDYIHGVLDKDRESSVKESLSSDHAVQRKYKKLISSISYLDELSQAEPPTDITEQLMQPLGYFEKLVEKTNYDQWPKTLKIGLETTLVVFMMACVLTITPWEKVIKWAHRSHQDEIILAEIVRQKNLIGSVAEIEKKQDSSVVPFVDEGVKPPPASTLVKNEPLKNSVRAPASLPQVILEKNAPEKASAKSSPPPVASGPGFLFRGDVEVTNVEVIGPKVAEAIKGLGGRKAGNVEIGWKRTPQSRYFHFVIPEAKYSELLALISRYGSIHFRKEKHPRLMPEGIIRIIMNMDEKKNDTK